jgi:hypothetical protein
MWLKQADFARSSAASMRRFRSSYSFRRMLPRTSRLLILSRSINIESPVPCLHRAKLTSAKLPAKAVYFPKAGADL